jgi:hypothetical protein
LTVRAVVSGVRPVGNLGLRKIHPNFAQNVRIETPERFHVLDMRVTRGRRVYGKSLDNDFGQRRDRLIPACPMLGSVVDGRRDCVGAVFYLLLGAALHARSIDLKTAVSELGNAE